MALEIWKLDDDVFYCCILSVSLEKYVAFLLFYCTGQVAESLDQVDGVVDHGIICHIPLVFSDHCRIFSLF